MYDISGILGREYMKVATQHKAVTGFRTCGIWPYDHCIFTDEDFIVAAVTNQALQIPIDNGNSKWRNIIMYTFNENKHCCDFFS